jgi:hypothetical protein
MIDRIKTKRKQGKGRLLERFPLSHACSGFLEQQGETSFAHGRSLLQSEPDYETSLDSRSDDDIDGLFFRRPEILDLLARQALDAGNHKELYAMSEIFQK